MRSKNIIYALAVLILSFIGCYDDKGNYDYADLNEIQIEEFNYISSPTLGDTIRDRSEVHLLERRQQQCGVKLRMDICR